MVNGGENMANLETVVEKEKEKAFKLIGNIEVSEDMINQYTSEFKSLLEKNDLTPERFTDFSRKTRNKFWDSIKNILNNVSDKEKWVDVVKKNIFDLGGYALKELYKWSDEDIEKIKSVVKDERKLELILARYQDLLGIDPNIIRNIKNVAESVQDYGEFMDSIQSTIRNITDRFWETKVVNVSRDFFNKKDFRVNLGLDKYVIANASGIDLSKLKVVNENNLIDLGTTISLAAAYTTLGKVTPQQLYSAGVSYN